MSELVNPQPADNPTRVGGDEGYGAAFLGNRNQGLVHGWKKLVGGIVAIVVMVGIVILVVFLTVGQSSPAAVEPRIKHVVVVYQENRAFDHLFGWSKLNVDGLTGEETNPIDLQDPSKGTVKVSANAPYISTFDPHHEMPAYNIKTFGKPGINQSKPTMNGFFAFEAAEHGVDKAHFVMQGFPAERLPVTSTLAKEYAIFDKWYTAFPGPSWPNHMFSLTGTSAGNTETSTFYGCHDNSSLFPQKTIFQSLNEKNLTWKIIYQDSRGDTQLEYLNTPEAAERTLPMDAFLQDAKHGTLPTLTWIYPRWGVNKSEGDWGGPNSDHPSCCDIALGEHLRKQVYEAVRAGPGWHNTLVLYMWDDPGGFYDHVKPPMSAPRPDDIPSCPDEGFLFDRLGSRVPVVAVSPWFNKGTVISDPDGPEPDSKYDSTSLVGTLKEMFGLPSFLTARDRWSGKFHKVLEQRKEPRADEDCPLVLPAAPKPGAWKNVTAGHRGLYDEECDQPSRSQRRAIQLMERQLGIEAPGPLHYCAHKEPHWIHRCPMTSRLDATEWLRATTEEWRRRSLLSRSVG